MKTNLFFRLIVGVVMVSASRAADIPVFAAASLKNAIIEVAVSYEREHPGEKWKLNLAGSNVLAQQIQEGAKADVFISADELKMDALEKAGLLAPGTRRALLSNTLVIVTPSDRPGNLASAKELAGEGFQRVALAETRTVPAGIYARGYLTQIGIWEKVARKVVPTENVRAALAAVESGNAQAGIVYKTDALISKDVKIALEISPAEGPKIVYPVAVLREAPHPAQARAVVDYLRSETATRIFLKHGFLIAP